MTPAELIAKTTPSDIRKWVETLDDSHEFAPRSMHKNVVASYLQNAGVKDCLVIARGKVFNKERDRIGKISRPLCNIIAHMAVMYWDCINVTPAEVLARWSEICPPTKEEA